MKIKKFLKILILSLIILSIIFVIILYFSFPIILKKINKEIIKKLEIKSYSIAKIKIGLNSIHLFDVILEIDENKKIRIKKIYAEFSIKTLLKKNYFINNLFLDGIDIYYIDKEIKEEKKEEFDLKKILKIPLVDVNVLLKQIFLKIKNIYYENNQIKCEIKETSLKIFLEYNKKGLKTKINSLLSDYQPILKINQGEQNFILNNFNINFNFDYKPEEMNFDIKFNTKLDNEKIKLSDFNIQTDVKIKNKKINLSLKGSERDFIDFNNEIIVYFDTNVEIVKIKINNLNQNANKLPDIIKIAEIRNNQKFFNWHLNIEKSDLICDLRKRNIEIKDFNVKIKNIFINENNYLLQNLNINTKLNTKINFDDAFNIQDGFKYDIIINGEIENIKFLDINLSNLKYNININKNNNKQFLKEAMQIVNYTNDLIKLKEEILKQLDKLDTFAISSVIEKIDYNNKISLANIEIINDYKNRFDEILITSKINNFSYNDFELLKLNVPLSEIKIKTKINNLKNYNITLIYNIPEIVKFNADGIIEIEEKTLNNIISKKDIQDIIKKIYVRQNLDLSVDLSKILEIAKIEKLEIDGKFTNKTIYFQDYEKEPIITTLLNFENVNIKYDNLLINDMDLILPIKDFQINQKVKENKRIESEQFTTKNLFIKRILFSNFETKNINSNLTIKDNYLILNNFAFNAFDGNIKVDLIIEYLKKNLETNLRFNNIDLSYITQNEKNRGKNYLTGLFKLKLYELLKDKKEIVNINNIECEIIVNNIKKEAVIEILNYLDPENKMYDFKKLHSILKLAKPDSLRIFLYAGYLQIFIKFDSKIINEFTIDRIPLNKFNLIKNLLKLEG